MGRRLAAGDKDAAVPLHLFMTMVLAASVPWYAPPTTSVVTKPVVFTHAGATLKGTLYLPVWKHPVPAVVVFHGASEPLASTPLYRHLTDGLPQIGIAVFVYDRRGKGASTGSEDVPYQTLADDGAAAAHALRAMPQIDARRVGYWGISQGGWLAAYAATRDPAAAFAVAVSAPLTTPEVQMEFADANHLVALGYPESAVRKMLEARRMWSGYLRGTNTRAQAVAAIANIQNEPWYQYMYMPTVAQLKGPAESTWRTQMDDDPLMAVQNVRIPMLCILGSSDPWIPVVQTVAALHRVASEDPNITYAVIPNVNHLMMTPPIHERMEDATPAAVRMEHPESAAYFMELASWLTKTLGI